jgi:ADP-heptose:LPS heptosyltransferase
MPMSSFPLPANVQRLATFAPVELGDTIMATGLYRALRIAFPLAHFSVLSQLPSHPVLSGFDVFDSVVAYDPNMNLASVFDLVVLPVLCGDSEVRRHFGNHPNLISADRLFAKQRSGTLNKWDGRYSHVLFYRHQVEMNLELARAAGYAGGRLPLYCPQDAPDEFARHQGAIGLFINTPANEFQAQANRQWPREHWRALVHKLGVENVLLLGGPGDRPRVEELSRETGASFCVTGSLGKLTALCQVLRTLVTTDGGAMHAAATTRVPIVSLHGTSSPILLHPWIFPEGRCIALLSPNSCSPCQRSYRLKLCEAGVTRMNCMQNIRPEMVVRAVNELAQMQPGTCLIMRGDRLLTKEAYLRSKRRKFEFTLNNNFARAALHLLPGN